MSFLIKTCLRVAAFAAAIIATITYIPGIHLSGGYATLMIVAAAWTAIVTVIRPILKIVAIPFSLLTFGLSSVVINAALFWVLTQVIPGFTTDGLTPVLFGSFVLAALTWVITIVL
jgi:putative membrane protein